MIDIKEAHGDIEINSFTQVKNIIDFGRIHVGCPIKKDHGEGDTEEQDNTKLKVMTLANIVYYSSPGCNCESINQIFMKLILHILLHTCIDWDCYTLKTIG